ncbi:transcription antiterminator [Mammaliicoccus vitulinus]|uniref:BglG family transcription antiterminator n=2 Tax=Mammaliicoccus vitulinus TaxID=71237 RepID=UPI000E67C4EC|nr:PTS sugar transporter subunit IIA [Mammaliicoccus vitulinus]RIN17527.1 transcription antiterminator [Mammaliicoccus vitulinus]
MKLTDRQTSLVEILVKQKGYATIKSYAEKLHVSNRTIHNDLNAISDYLVTQGYQIVKQPGRGVIVNQLKSKNVQDESNINSLYSTEGRRLRIIEMLLFENRTVTFEHLSDIFIVSKSSISYDLNFINQLLTTGNKARIVSDLKGTRILGNEIEIQKCFQEFNLYLLKEHVHLFEHNESKRFDLLSKYYGKDIVNVCSRVLYSYMRVNSGVIDQHYVINILSVLIIMIYRMKKGYNVIKVKAEKDITFENIAKSLINKISLRIQVNYTLEDIKFLSTFLKSYHFETFPDISDFKEVTDKMIKKVGDSLNVNFTYDEVLLNHLLNHIPPMFYRLQQNVHIKNPFVFQIKQEFSLVFNLIWILLREYEEKWNITFNEDEIGFLTIHFQSALERKKKSRRILVVCPTGIATSELLANRLTNILPSIITIEIASKKEVEAIDLQAIDLIVSTTNLDVDSNKLIVVSPFLNEYDRLNISRYFNEELQNKQEYSFIENSFPYLSQLIKKEYIFINQNFDKQEDLLNDVGTILLKNGVVKEGFIRSLIKREELGGTDLPTGIAIPHGNPKYVNETNITIVINEKSIKWNEQNLKIIVIISIAEKDVKRIKNILTDVYSIVNNKNLLNELDNVRSKEQVYEILGG